jgi:hypothetical protein
MERDNTIEVSTSRDVVTVATALAASGVRRRGSLYRLILSSEYPRPCWHEGSGNRAFWSRDALRFYLAWKPLFHMAVALKRPDEVRLLRELLTAASTQINDAAREGILLGDMRIVESVE